MVSSTVTDGRLGTSVPTGALCVVGELAAILPTGGGSETDEGFESLQPARSPQVRKRTNKILHARLGEERTIVIYTRSG